MSEEVEVPQEASNPVQSDMAQQIAALATEEASYTPAVPDGDIDVPISDFWDNKPQAGAPAEEQAEVESVESVDVPASDEQIIRYKANGQELEISLEEARQKLAMAEGGAKAFSKLAQANKRVKELESNLPELQKKAELLDKLEEVKHDWKAVLQIATGQDPEQFLAEAMRKQRILETGTDVEKSQLEREERFAQLERQLRAQEEKQAEIEKREKERLYNAEKSSLKSMLEGEFFKHKVELESEVDSNEVNEMLWQNSQRKMAKYVKKYQDHPRFQELLPKMVQKSFEEEAGKLKRLATGSVQAKVDEAIKQKKAKAAEQAAIASTSRIAEPDMASFKGKSVREIADMLIGKKRFTY